MQTIKIIDLLNKITKGEEVPKKIKYKSELYEYKSGIDYTKGRYDYLLGGEPITIEFLNEEVEIIEEDKKINKFHCNNSIWEEQARDLDYMFKDKIDELIDIVNDLKKEGKSE